ncbi:hypothetical protein PsYK624_031420 [Phanerochaete sordida]|uniref:Protection of telomeres protein 1 n=1 Tax=Phanerochaete sordida TaxID=48140 RepID=A0A9P3G385_9APHY|nr:hypothetical protein PsYK624_031420 [Phanerochaete sordida]
MSRPDNRVNAARARSLARIPTSSQTMKRARRRADLDAGGPAKRPRTRSGDKAVAQGDNPFHSSLKRSASDVCEGSTTDGFLLLNVARKPAVVHGAVRLVVDAHDKGDSVEFDVVFPPPCTALLTKAGVEFCMNDSFMLSLKGAQVERKEIRTSGRTVTKLLPMVLSFPRGVSLRFSLVGASPLSGQTFDLWTDAASGIEPEEPARPPSALAPSQEDWFLTPVEPPPSATPATSADTVPSQQLAEPSDAARAEASPPAADGTPVPSGKPNAEEAPDPETDGPQKPPPPAPLTAEPRKAPPNRPLYRNVPGRVTRTATAAAAKKSTANAPKAARSKETTPAPPAPAPPVQEALEPELASAAATDTGAPQETKKAQKRKAKLAKKAGKIVEQAGAAQEQEQEPPRDPAQLTHDATPVPKPATASKSPPAQVPQLKPSGSTSTTASAEAGPSSAKPGPSSQKSQPQASSSAARAPPAMPQRTTRPSTPVTASTSSAKAPTKSFKGSSVSSQPSSRPSLATSASGQDPGLALEAGCVGDNGLIYSPLASLRENFNVNCIAVVASAPKEPSRTSTNEWKLKLVLVDPSNADLDNMTHGFTMNCFKKDDGELPQCKQGDVIILTTFQVKSFHERLEGLCASYLAWTWTLFDPEAGKTTLMHPAQPQPGARELAYCVALNDWWRALRREQERERSNVISHQIGGDASREWPASQRYSVMREHRLIQDASPQAQPNGYFDCTVEVLHGHKNSLDNVYSVYVTDYTLNERVTPITAGWCPHALAPYVLRIEMWDEAAPRGAQLKPHTYVALKNVRMQVAKNGHWEAKFTHAQRLRVLDEDELEGEEYLVKLLERKAKWEKEAEAKGEYQFPHKLISEAALDSHFCCTVEVLLVKQKEATRTLMWVTDYTTRADLAPIASTAAEHAHGLPTERILKVALTDEQAGVGAALAPGDVVAVRKLRLKGARGRDVAGVLSGSERLVHKLNPQTTGSEECLALLSRKKAWKKQVEEEKARGKAKPNGKAGGAPNGKGTMAVRKKQKEPAKERPRHTVTLRQLHSLHDGSKPMWYRVVARVVDFFPHDIKNWVVLHCTGCDKDIPESFRICTRCDTDMAETHVRPFYRFWLEIEDEDGARECVIGAFSSYPFLPDFLEDLPPADLRDDEEALEKLTERLRPLLGSDLIDNYNDLLQNAKEDGSIDPSDAPLLTFVIGAKAGDNPHLSVMKCSPLE